VDTSSNNTEIISRYLVKIKINCSIKVDNKEIVGEKDNFEKKNIIGEEFDNEVVDAQEGSVVTQNNNNENICEIERPKRVIRAPVRLNL